MHLLTPDEFNRQAKPIIRKLFIENEDEKPFQPTITERLFLHFPLGGDPQKTSQWEAKLFMAINQAMQVIGNKGCYLMTFWQAVEKHQQYAYIPKAEFHKAFVNNEIWEKLDIWDGYWYSLFSQEGNWGLRRTIDDYAFLGGDSQFMKVLYECYPDIEREIFQFIQVEQQEGEPYDLKWLTEIFAHIYGDRAQEKIRLLQETKI